MQSRWNRLADGTRHTTTPQWINANVIWYRLQQYAIYRNMSFQKLRCSTTARGKLLTL